MRSFKDKHLNLLFHLALCALVNKMQYLPGILAFSFSLKPEMFGFLYYLLFTYLFFFLSGTCTNRKCLISFKGGMFGFLSLYRHPHICGRLVSERRRKRDRDRDRETGTDRDGKGRERERETLFTLGVSSI